MRFFIYEFVSGGGWWSVDKYRPPAGSLLNEGSAMLRALVRDFNGLGSVCTLLDSRCQVDVGSAELKLVESAQNERDYFSKMVQAADWTVVVAPEFAGHLLTRCRWVERLGGRLLGPGTEFVAIASEKDATARRLAAGGVPVPRGCLVSSVEPLGVDLAFPAVLKPNDGAGSLDISMVHSWDELHSVVQVGRAYRLEEFHQGLAASVSVLAGPHTVRVLPASRQQLKNFQYLGGEAPLPIRFQERAERMAKGVIAAMPPAIGYWGIDLVFGDASDGREDVVIEVNPRVTTSYLGLQRLARGNLAREMFNVATGGPVELSFDEEPVQFAADSLARLN